MKAQRKRSTSRSSRSSGTFCVAENWLFASSASEHGVLQKISAHHARLIGHEFAGKSFVVVSDRTSSSTVHVNVA